MVAQKWPPGHFLADGIFPAVTEDGPEMAARPFLADGPFLAARKTEAGIEGVHSAPVSSTLGAGDLRESAGTSGVCTHAKGSSMRL